MNITGAEITESDCILLKIWEEIVVQTPLKFIEQKDIQSQLKQKEIIVGKGYRNETKHCKELYI